MNTEKVKILFVTTATKGGGAERMLVNIINSLPDEKYSIKLIITSADEIPSDLNSNVMVCRYGYKAARTSFFKIRKEIKSFRPDYTFTTSSNLGYLLLLIRLIVKHRYKVYIRVAVSPSEVYIHSSASLFTYLKQVVLNNLIKNTYSKSDLIIAQTEFMRNDISNAYKVDINKIMCIRNIIDKKKLLVKSSESYPAEFEKGYYNIVASGALYSVKGFDLLIEALGLIDKKYLQQIKLFILGDERYEIGYTDILRSIINSLQLNNNVFLLGHKENPYVYYKNADLFVLSSRKEGFPNVVLEALYLQTPVIATNCVDFEGVLFNDVNGYVVEKESSVAIAHAIEKSFERRFSQYVFPDIENFNYETIFV